MVKVKSLEIAETNLRALIFFALLVPAVAAVCFVAFSAEKPGATAAQNVLKVENLTRETSTNENLPADDYQARVEEVKKKLPGNDFSVIVQKPFVVIGDEPLGTLKERCERINWTVERLKRIYFKKDPTEILEIWLFKNKTSYEKYAKEIFGDTPTTPFGYYSPSHKALIMNIGTGGGTLVHEIVHPFMDANFPARPAWFNEGLASLYEQTGEADGEIHGFTNWRLPGLQNAIQKGAVPSFKALTATTDEEFYADQSGVHYAAARYLCYYLQQKKLLAKFYQEFTQNAAKDPSGYDTLQKVLAERDMAAFQKKWEAFVLKLRVGFEVEVRAED